MHSEQKRIWIEHSRLGRWLTPRRFLWLGLLGLMIRLIGACLYGTQDTEYWKGWAAYAVSHPVVDIYGATDKEIIAAWRESRNCKQVLLHTQRVIPFPKVYCYSVRGYPLCQPPLFLYSIYPSAWLYHFVSPTFDNSRLCNFFTNLQPILFSFLTALAIAWFVKRSFGSALGRIAFLAFWLNPLVILNTPVQGYQDAFCSLLVMLAVLAAFYRRPMMSYVVLVLSFLIKPWGIFVAPALLWVLLREHTFWKNCQALMGAMLVALFVCLPFVASSHFLSVVLGVVFSLGQHTLKLSLQSLNFWWPVQYVTNVFSIVATQNLSFWQAASGTSAVYEDITTATFSSLAGVPVTQLSLLLWFVFTLYNLRWIAQQLPHNRKAIIIGCAMQIYSWFILRTGLQGHHAFVLIPVFALVAFDTRRMFFRYLVCCTLLFIQEMIFYGLGRDFNPMRSVLVTLHIPWITVVIAFAQTLFFLFLAREFKICPSLFNKGPIRKGAHVVGNHIRNYSP